MYIRLSDIFSDMKSETQAGRGLQPTPNLSDGAARPQIHIALADKFHAAQAGRGLRNRSTQPQQSAAMYHKPRISNIWESNTGQIYTANMPIDHAHRATVYFIQPTCKLQLPQLVKSTNIHIHNCN